MFLVVVAAAAGVEPLPIGSGYVNQGDALTRDSQTTQRFALIDVCSPAARENDVNGFMKRRLRDADRDDRPRPQDRLDLIDACCVVYVIWRCLNRRSLAAPLPAFMHEMSTFLSTRSVLNRTFSRLRRFVSPRNRSTTFFKNISHNLEITLTQPFMTIHCRIGRGNFFVKIATRVLVLPLIERGG